MELFAPRVQSASLKILEFGSKTREISKIIAEIRELTDEEAKEDDGSYRKKDGGNRGLEKDSKDAKVYKLPGFSKLMDACNKCSTVFKDISDEITAPGAENISSDRLHVLGLQIEEQRYSLQMNLQLFHVHV